MSASANWFVGVPVDGGFVETLPRPPRGLRLVAPADLHLTVAFFGASGGERARAAFERAGGLLRERPLGPFSYTLDELVALGPRRRYSALAATLGEGRAEAEALIGALRGPLLEAAGGPPDERPPLPHVTLARPRRRAGALERGEGLAWTRLVDLSGVRGQVDRLALYTWANDRRERAFHVVDERALESESP